MGSTQKNVNLMKKGVTNGKGFGRNNQKNIPNPRYIPNGISHGENHVQELINQYISKKKGD